MTARQKWQRLFLAAFLILAGATVLLWAARYYAWIVVNSAVLLTLWRAAGVAYFGYALLRRSLTSWIVVGMLAGVEIGHDLRFLAKDPRDRAVADFQLLSQIFLRLIKT